MSGNDGAPPGYGCFRPKALGTTGVLAINQWIYANPQYQPERDFAPIIKTASTPNRLVMHLSVKANTMKELVAQSKAEPGRLSRHWLR